jgi:hypothetical protein
MVVTPTSRRAASLQKAKYACAKKHEEGGGEISF